MKFPAKIDLGELSVPVVTGAGCSRELGIIAREAGGSRVLLVTDPGIVSVGHAAAMRDRLNDAGLVAEVYDQVCENPTTEVVDGCVEAARELGADLLVGLGGGSSMDAAKGCNFIYTNGGRIEDYWGEGKASKPMLPFIAVPTTGGTGSECQRFALISQPGSHRKIACGDRKTLAKVAILDPELTMTQPPFVTACTGMDAIAHAVESSVTRAGTGQSLRLATEAFRLLDGHFHRVLSEPDDLQARAAMQLGAAFAGAAIEHSMLGAAHSGANPLTSTANVVHGQAVGIMLSSVVQFNGQEESAVSGYRVLMESVEGNADSPAEWLARRIDETLARAELACSLGSFGIKPEHLVGLAEDAVAQWTAQFNPRTIAREDFVRMYEGVI